MSRRNSTLILGIGNLLLGDEGVGVHAVRALEGMALPSHVRCLDGGTGSFTLLEPMCEASRIILIDATLDGGDPGQITRLQPKFASEYPRTLTAHDVGLKDLLDCFYLMEHEPEVILFAVTITYLGKITDQLTPTIQAIIPDLVDSVMGEFPADTGTS